MNWKPCATEETFPFSISYNITARGQKLSIEGVLCLNIKTKDSVTFPPLLMITRYRSILL